MPARQQQVLGVPGIGVEGDFADMNPRYSVIAGPGGLVAGASGVYVGRACWLSQQSIDPDNGPQIVNNFGSGVPDGIVPRSGQLALITQYLADATLQIQGGAGMWAMSSGGLLVRNTGASLASLNMKAYANVNNGLFSFAATGSPTTSSSTSTTVAAGTWSATGSITGNVMTVGVVTGTYGVVVGSVVSGGASGTTVVAQLTGQPGAAGTYAVSIPEQAVAAGTSLSGTFGVLTVGGTITGAIVINALVAGTGIPTGSILTTTATQNSAFTGAGGAGTYGTNLTGTGGSGTITFTTNVETKWYARSQGGNNELIKISDITQ